MREITLHLLAEDGDMSVRISPALSIEQYRGICSLLDIPFTRDDLRALFVENVSGTTGWTGS